MLTQRKRWIHEGEDPIDLLNVQDVAKGISSRREEESDDEEVVGERASEE